MIIIGMMGQAQTFHWAKQFSSNSENSGSSLAKSPEGDIIVGGTFEGTVDFDPGEGTYYLTSFGDKDVFVAKMDVNGNLLWVKQIGGSEADLSRKVNCDNAGNIYITGAFMGTADMDPGDATFNFTSFGGKDVFLVELNEDGDFLWAGQMGGAFDGTGTGIAIAPSGNIYFSGYFIGTFDFDPGASEYFLSTNGQSIYIEKLNSNHEFVWAKTVGGTLFDYCQSMCLDELENVYTIGSFKDVADFDPGDGIVYFTSAGGNDIYINKLNSAGEYVWAKQMSGPEDEFGQGIVYDNNENLYFTGNFKNTVDFAPDAGNLYMTSLGDYDIFTGKMDVDGNLLWVKQMGGAGNQTGQALALDDNNNVYTTGHYEGAADFNPGDGTYEMTSAGDFDAFVSKLNDDGLFVWAAGMGGALFDRGYSIITDGQTNVYTTGWFAGTADFDPGTGTFYLTSASDRNTFVSKLGTEIAGVEENNIQHIIKIYPNPVTESFLLDLGEVFSYVSVDVFNVSGQVIFNKNYFNESDVSITLNGAPGLYFVKVTMDDGQTISMKIIKQ